MAVIRRGRMGVFPRSGADLKRPREDDAAEVRRDISRDLHDTVAQSLATMIIEMEAFKAEQYGRATVIKTINDLQAMGRQALQELRENLYELRDEAAYDFDFPGRINELANAFAARTGIKTYCEFSDLWRQQRLTRGAANHLSSLVNEALNNAWRHGGATGVRVIGSELPDMAILSIVDDGVGISQRGAEREGLGIRGMRERAVLVGADLLIQSSHNEGTSVTVVIHRNVSA